MPENPGKLSLFIAEMKRRGVTRLATIYAVAGLGIVEAMDIIGGRFSMPDWTVRVVIIVALVGFPVTMLLGWIYDITSKGIVKTESLSPSEKAKLPALSWKPSWISIILFLILILTTTAFFVVPRPNPFGFKDEDWVLIADLENNTEDEVFDITLMHALTVTINQSRHINIYPRTQVAEVLKRMQRESVERIDVPIALEIAVREHIKAVLVPTISEVGGTYVLSARLLNPETGETVRSSQSHASSKEDVLKALDELAIDVRKDLGESLQMIHLKNVPLHAATTHSLEALQYLTNSSYVTGVYDYDGKKQMLHEAIELDPEFALAHSNLSALYYWTNDRVKGEEHAEIALSLLDRLTERERLWILAAIEGYRGNRHESIIKWGSFLSKYPNDYAGWYRLGYNYMMSGQHEESISAFTRAQEIYNDEDPSALINIATAYVKLEDFEKSIEHYLRAFKADPQQLLYPSLNHEFGFTYVAMGELEEAKEVFEKLKDGNDGQRAQCKRSLALLSMFQGKYAEAIPLMHESILIYNSIKYGLSEYRNRLYLARIYERAGMKKEFDAELDLCNEMVHEVASEPRWFMHIARLNIRNGDLERAEDLLGELQQRINTGNRVDESDFSLLKGEIELAKGNHALALELLESANTLSETSISLESLAHYYFTTGDWSNAISTYEDIIQRKGESGWEGQEFRIQAVINLGKAYESAGDKEKAVLSYQRLLDEWAEADEDLPDLIDIKNRLDQIQSTSP